MDSSALLTTFALEVWLAGSPQNSTAAEQPVLACPHHWLPTESGLPPWDHSTGWGSSYHPVQSSPKLSRTHSHSPSQRPEVGRWSRSWSAARHHNWFCISTGVSGMPIVADLCRAHHSSAPPLVFHASKAKWLSTQVSQEVGYMQTQFGCKEMVTSILHFPTKPYHSSSRVFQRAYRVNILELQQNTGKGNPQPKACQWKHPAINSQTSKSRNCS